MRNFGCLIPASNIVAERELYTRLVMDNIQDVCFHFARLKFKTRYGDNEEQYTKELVASIPETLAELDKINIIKMSVLCTSAEVYCENKMNLIFPLSSIILCFKKFKVNKPLIISPYNSEIGKMVTDRLKENNILPQKEIHLNIKTKDGLLKFSKYKLLSLINDEINANIDSICVLCTNFSTFYLEEIIEKTFKMPFISSNKAIYLDLLGHR